MFALIHLQQQDNPNPEGILDAAGAAVYPDWESAHRAFSEEVEEHEADGRESQLEVIEEGHGLWAGGDDCQFFVIGAHDGSR